MNSCSAAPMRYIVCMEPTTSRLSDTQIARYHACLADPDRSVSNRILSARRLANHYDATDQAGKADLLWATIEGLEEQL